MRHLTALEIQQLSDAETGSREIREHFSHCGVCQQRAVQAQRIERALGQLERIEPSVDLSERIMAALPQEARQSNGAWSPWLGVTTLFAALLGFALAYQTAFTLRANGAFELVSYYTTQPEIVTTYPNQAWEALASAIPWLTAAVSIVMLAVALVLTYRWTARSSTRVIG